MLCTGIAGEQRLDLPPELVIFATLLIEELGPPTRMVIERSVVQARDLLPSPRMHGSVWRHARPRAAWFAVDGRPCSLYAEV